MIFSLFLISFAASIIGSICGIGGGVIIKPALDAFKILDVSTINFLSGCTVLSMSFYTVIMNRCTKDACMDIRKGTYLALGATMGGFIGKEVFTILIKYFQNTNTISAIQAFSLIIITTGTLIYTLKKHSIKTRYIANPILLCFIGIVLGIMSSFLGIGGGPINLVVLYYFFSLSTKQAATYSLYIILFSQASSIIKTIIDRSIPTFDYEILTAMICAGLLGSMVGRIINRQLSDILVDRLFIIIMVLIIFMNIFNVYQFTR